MALLFVAAAACSPSSAADAGVPDAAPFPRCELPYAGDRIAPMHLDVVALTAEGGLSPVEEGSTVPLLFPPQGGRVAFIGVHADNLDPCDVRLSGALRDEVSGQVRFDNRTVSLRMQPDGGAASVAANFTTFANIPACPNQWASQDVFGSTFLLEVRVTDRTGKAGSADLHVVPFCGEPTRESECRCICRAGYVLGEVCASDGGAG